MLLNNKKTRATMKLVWEYVRICSGLSEIDMLSKMQNLEPDFLFCTHLYSYSNGFHSHAVNALL